MRNQERVIAKYDFDEYCSIIEGEDSAPLAKPSQRASEQDESRTYV